MGYRGGKNDQFTSSVKRQTKISKNLFCLGVLVFFLKFYSKIFPKFTYVVVRKRNHYVERKKNTEVNKQI